MINRWKVSKEPLFLPCMLPSTLWKDMPLMHYIAFFLGLCLTFSLCGLTRVIDVNNTVSEERWEKFHLLLVWVFICYNILLQLSLCYKRLTSIQVPDVITRQPRSISESNHWNVFFFCFFFADISTHHDIVNACARGGIYCALLLYI